MPTQNIGLPLERYRQLQQIAALDGVTVVDVVSDFINDAIAAGRIPDSLPGWTVRHKSNGTVQLATEVSDFDVTMSKASAVVLADEIDRLAQPNVKAKAILDLDANVKIERTGPALALTDINSGARYTAARNVMVDIARLLRDKPLRTID
ncbi:hypothetical protein [Mesorhizobium sp. Root172]|uniref:hypothetical protein n=1 Tax=Mesorhizobium sp. Root172 TaxID=1736481 RepID=UPI000713E807|nr:hypothetical protein [Mesorhizobium sp. Root172]KRB31711.1 hypothetical protein ASE05_01260 [Mesorhizobium sp. Root172]